MCCLGDEIKSAPPKAEGLQVGQGGETLQNAQGLVPSTEKIYWGEARGRIMKYIQKPLDTLRPLKIVRASEEYLRILDLRGTLAISNLAPRTSWPEEDNGHKIMLISLDIYNNIFLLCNHLKANNSTLFFF